MAMVELDRKGCIGCHACANVCPSFWEMQEDGKTMLKGSSEIGSGIYRLIVDDPKCNEQAKSVCPVDVINIR